jgi:hypothetical protein
LKLRELTSGDFGRITALPRKVVILPAFGASDHHLNVSSRQDFTSLNINQNMFPQQVDGPEDGSRTPSFQDR